MRPYWLLCKGKDYISGTDEYGYPTHSKDRNQAWKFYDFTIVMSYVSMGYCAVKEW